NNFFFFTGNSGLCIAWGLVCGTFKMPVSASAHSAFGYYFFFAILSDFKKYFVGFFVSNDSSQRHFHVHIFTIGSGTALFSSVFSVSGFKVSLKFIGI